MLSLLLVTSAALGATKAQPTRLGQALVAGAWLLGLNLVLFFVRGLLIVGVSSLDAYRRASTNEGRMEPEAR